MRPLYVTAVFLVAWAALAQEVKRPVLSSHDRINGPFAGEYHVEDLQVFQDGKVVYVEEGIKSMGVGQPEHSVYESTIGSDDMRRLAQRLDSREIRSLPKKISAKIRPIDFFWQKSLEINRHSAGITIIRSATRRRDRTEKRVAQAVGTRPNPPRERGAQRHCMSWGRSPKHPEVGLPGSA